MSTFGYTMYCRKTMNTLLPVMEGEIEKYYNSKINKLCHKMKVSCFQDISIYIESNVNAPVLSDIDGSGLREMLTYYNFKILLESNANAPVLSDIDGSGPREKAYIL